MITLEACAYHEAGHAVVGATLGYKVKHIAIGICGGRAPIYKDENLEHSVLTAYAGGAAQTYYDWRSVKPWHDGDDLARILKIQMDGGISKERRLELAQLVQILVEHNWPKRKLTEIQRCLGRLRDIASRICEPRKFCDPIAGMTVS